MRVGPRRHQLGPVGGRDRRRPAAAASARASGAHPSVCTASSRTPAPSPQPVHAANAPPPTWTTHAVEVGAGVGQLPPDRAPAVEAQRVLRALHAERDGAGGDGLAEPQHGRVARRVARAAARTGGSPPRAPRAAPSTAGDAHVGTNTSIGHDARWASVAAAIAALPHEAMASGRRCPVASRSDSAATRCSRIVTRWRPLWLPPTLPVSSLTQTSAPTASDERRRAGERRHREARRRARGSAPRTPPRSCRGRGRTPTRPGAARSARTGSGRRAARRAGPTSCGCSTW